MKFASVLETVGNTPLVALQRMAEAHGLSARLYAKLESANPGGSAKDRVAVSILRDAEAQGELQKGGTVIECTSGNTGVGLAMCAAVLGYRAVITMPDSMSQERIRLMRAFGAEVVLTPGAEGMAGAERRAAALAREIPGSFLARQFENPANPAAHTASTGPEIWNDLSGDVAAFVAGVGTGGTATGVGRYLKGQNPAVAVFGAEPAESPLLSAGHVGAHGIQGIGANFVPAVLDRAVVDEILTVPTETAMETARELARTEGILCGISSGCAAAAALEIARRTAFAGRNIVVLFPDTGERYLSTALFSD